MNFRNPTVLQTLLVLCLRTSFDPVTAHAHKGLRKAQEHAEHSNPPNPITESYPDLLYGNLANAVDEGEDEHRYIVVFKPGSDVYKKRVDNARRKLSVAPGSSHLGDKFIIRENAEVMILSSDEDVAKMANNEEVEYVERDSKVYMQQFDSSETTPYGINLVNALQVSDEFVHKKKVCIIDSGYDITHPDLPSGTKVTGAEDGGAGIWSQDGDGHGTHVAGTIAAIGQNGKGVMGVVRSGELNIHVVRVFGNDGGWAWTSTLMQAVQECVDVNSDIVSMSLGGGGRNNVEESFMKSVYEDDGVLLIAAAGNDGNTAFSYPASYDSVMSVAAVDESENHADFSQRNSQVDIAAPGVSVLSTLPNNSYSAYSGTSMATPHVSGVAALIWSHDESKSAAEVWEALTQSAKDLGDEGRDDKYGFGLVQADKALEYLTGNTPAPVPPTPSPTYEGGCVDSPSGWYDRDGPQYDCDWYALSNHCEVYGDQFPNNGITANMACCVCDGGSTGSTPTTAPVPTPTPAPTKSPTRAPTKSPTKAPTRAPTRAPTEAPVSPPPTTQPVNSPTPSPTIEGDCVDSPSDWHDIDGTSFDCDWYALSNHCEVYGDLFANDGITANMACCVCGGGSTGSPPTTPAPTPSPTIEGDCVDSPSDWHDVDGTSFDCDWYALSDHCEVYGDLFANDGITANMACCVCGGGSTAA